MFGKKLSVKRVSTQLENVCELPGVYSLDTVT